MKSKTSAALFAFFLGGFGAHKFYLGKTGLGILYLVFFWTFIPAFVAFIEFIILLAMNDDSFNQKYNLANVNITNTADELEKLYTLKEKGVITEAEYENRKKRLI